MKKFIVTGVGAALALLTIAFVSAKDVVNKDVPLEFALG